MLLNAQSTLLGGQEFELTKQKAKEYMAGYDKSVELIDKTMSGSSDSTTDIIMWYDCDSGTSINTRPDNGWWPLNPGYPNDPVAGGLLTNNYYYLKRASDGAILDSARPPESDSFSLQIWDVSQYIGTEVYIEIVDNNSGSGYAWLAADDFILGGETGDTLDFESGSYAADWQVISGNAFGTTPNSTVHGSMSGQQGKYWADSWSGAGESAIGVLRSKNFTITKSITSRATISFLKAGWDGTGGNGPWRTTTSLLGTYQSQDPAVIKQHAYWIKALGCNVMACDLTNSGPSGKGAPYYFNGINLAFELILKNLPEITEFEAPSVYPVIRLTGTNYSNLTLMLDDMYALYQQYPAKWYKLDDGTANKDKPFIEIFADWSLLNTWAQSGIPAQAQDDRFNIRYSNGYLLSQPAITQLDNNNIHKIPGSVPYWLFVENTQDPLKGYGYYEPVYKEMPNGQGVEQMITWASVCINGSDWDGLRDTVDGKTPIVRYTEPVFNLKPKVLLACRFNYPIAWLSHPWEGVSRNKSTHIEPNVDWGFLEFNNVADELYSVKNYGKVAPPTPVIESFNAVQNILKIKLDGFPLEYRISNNENLGGTQWTFLNVGKGGMILDSTIDIGKEIYIQTRNSFGVSQEVAQSVSGVKKSDSSIPNNFALSQNYPNPFNPSTEIKYSIPKSGIVTLKVYNLLGQEVATLVNQEQKSGNYVVNFDASKLASGVYMYRIEANGFSLTKKMALLK